MTDNTKEEQALEQLFEAAKAAPADLTPGLRGRLDRDIAEVVGDQPPRRTEPGRTGWRLWDWLPTAGGLAAAAACGVVIGLNTETNLLLTSTSDASETLELSAFFAGADPGVFFVDEDGS